MPTTINIEYSKAVNITTGETWITIKSGNTILEGENPVEAFKKILEDNNACHHLAAQPQVRLQKEENISTDWVEAIKSCKDFKTLSIYKPMIKGNVDAQRAYDDKLIQFSQTPD